MHVVNRNTAIPAGFSQNTLLSTLLQSGGGDGGRESLLLGRLLWNLPAVICEKSWSQSGCLFSAAGSA